MYTANEFSLFCILISFTDWSMQLNLINMIYKNRAFLLPMQLNFLIWFIGTQAFMFPIVTSPKPRYICICLHHFGGLLKVAECVWCGIYNWLHHFMFMISSFCIVLLFIPVWYVELHPK